MALKRWLFGALLLIVPWALAGDEALSAEFLQYLAEFSDDRGNCLDPELIEAAEDQANTAIAVDTSTQAADGNTQYRPAVPASAGAAFSQGE